MKYKSKLTLAQLIREMRDASHPYGRTVHSDLVSDIADLVECREAAADNCTWFERYWGIRFSGTIMCRTHDFGEWDKDTIDRYRIMWSEQSGWTFEEL